MFDLNIDLQITLNKIHMKKLCCISFLLFFLAANLSSKDKIDQPLKIALSNNSSMFIDKMYTSLSSKTSIKEINKVKNTQLQIAMKQMLDGTYPYEYRVQNYRNYLDIKELSKKIKTGNYSQFENPTGIYFEQGEEFAVILEETHGDSIKLRITNFGKAGGNSSYPLVKGINIIKAQNEGNGYVSYYTQTDELSKEAKIHIIGGKVNGVFNIKKHSNKDWSDLLLNASSETLDIMGERVQLAYNVEALKRYCPKDGVALTNLYDSIIFIQHDLMGLNKYKRVPNNHIFGRVIWKGYMHADQLGAAFHNDAMHLVADPNFIRQNSWGIAHEFGHVNQIRPWMKWTGTTEVTNNIFSVWTQYTFNPKYIMLEKEEKSDYDNREDDFIGGRMTSYMESAFIKKQEWLTQAGPDRWERKNPRDWGGDHFVKLIPMWQLELYFFVAGKGNAWYKPDFFADINIKAIDRNDLPKDAAEAQLEFVRQACISSQLDLTDFFEVSGILRPIDKWVDDYTCSQMTITEDDIVKVKQFAAQFKKPDTPVLHYITSNSVDCYRYKKSVEGIYNKGVTVGEKYLLITHLDWRNVVAFETYVDDELVKIAFSGAGSPNNNFTFVRYPESATRVEAVSWDGKRYLVFGKR